MRRMRLPSPHYGAVRITNKADDAVEMVNGLDSCRCLCDRLSPVEAPRNHSCQVRTALKDFLAAHDWARDESKAYGGSEIVTELLA